MRFEADEGAEKSRTYEETRKSGHKPLRGDLASKNRKAQCSLRNQLSR